MEGKPATRSSRSTSTNVKKRTKHQKSKGNVKKGKNLQENPPNPWAYCVKLPVIKESEKCDLADLSMLNCRSNYCIKSVTRGYTEKSKDDEVYRIYGSLVNQGVKFMRQWVRCFALTRKKYVTNLARDYLKEKNIKLNAWIVGIKNGDCADILALFLLNVVTGVHSFVHTKHGIWSTLHDNIANHQEYIQRCNLHLCYLGNGIYVELVPRMETVPFEIFGVTDPVNISMDAQPVAIGTITSDEKDTITELLSTGITTMSRTEKPSSTTTAYATTSPTPTGKNSRSSSPPTGEPSLASPACASTSHAFTGMLEITDTYDTYDTEQAQLADTHDSEQAQHVHSHIETQKKSSSTIKEVRYKTKWKLSVSQTAPSQTESTPPTPSTCASPSHATTGTRVTIDTLEQKKAQLVRPKETTQHVRNPPSTSIPHQHTPEYGDYSQIITNQPSVRITRLTDKDIKKATVILKKRQLKASTKQLGVFPNYTTAKKFRFKISKYGIK